VPCFSVTYAGDDNTIAALAVYMTNPRTLTFGSQCATRSRVGSYPGNHRAAFRVVAAALLASSAGCYHLGAKDIFEVAFHPIADSTRAGLLDAHHHVRPLSVPAAPSLSAYWDDGDNPRGVLLFFNGNGYGAEAAMRRMLVPARALGLDLVVFNYYDVGHQRPSMTEMRRISDALFDAIQVLPSPAARRVFAGGHSLGAAFALATAMDRPVAGVFLAAPATTGIAMLHHQFWYTRAVQLRPDHEYAQFDNLALAPAVRAPTLVVGSTGDRSLPPAFTDQVFSGLSSAIRKRKLILDGVAHLEYFAREEFWRAVSEFFGLTTDGPLVGYLK
jgi:pimeloyl-ACP methyl ester carboxylesterase